MKMVPRAEIVVTTTLGTQWIEIEQNPVQLSKNQNSPSHESTIHPATRNSLVLKHNIRDWNLQTGYKKAPVQARIIF
jgi:hypothetical protein